MKKQETLKRSENLENHGLPGYPENLENHETPRHVENIEHLQNLA